jgi:hypothetical protein
MLGPALKIALASTWPYVGHNAQVSQSDGDLVALVATAQLVDQLQILRWAYLGFGAEGRVCLDARGIDADGSVREALNTLRSAFAPRGEILRLAESTTRALQGNAAAAFEGVLRVLSGEAPSLVPGLKDTWLSLIPPTTPSRFWEGLAARLLIWLSLIASQKERIDPIQPMSAKNSVAVVDIGVAPSRQMTVHTAELFWTKQWYARRSTFEHRDLIGDRPVMRIQSRPVRYCTSLVLVGDSINWFVESSVMKYPGSAGVPLPDVCFREVLSKPFEDNVRHELAALGFRAAGVTDKGAWLLPGHPIDLSRLAGGRPPGEIDVLATHDEGCVVVCECKVLSFPCNESRLRNLLRKLGSEDSEAIRSTVRKKLEWARAVAQKLGKAPRVAAAYVVLDGPWPGVGTSSDVSVLDISELKATIRVLLGALQQ